MMLQGSLRVASIGLLATMPLGGAAALGMTADASPAAAASGGTFECVTPGAGGNPATVVVDTAMSPGTKGSTGISYATKNASTTTYCTLSGAVPRRWSVSMFGGYDLYLANGAVNDGTIAIGSEFDSFNQVAYSGSLIGAGTFTNAGTLVTEEDPADTSSNGEIVFLELARFVNEGTFDIDPGHDSKTGSVTFGFQPRLAGADDGVPPTTAMTFVNDGILDASAHTSLALGSSATGPASFTLDNDGTFDVAPTASVVAGQSNGYSCVLGHDPVGITLAPSSVLDEQGSFIDYCNTFVVNGGSLKGAGRVLLTGSRGASSIGLDFAVAPGQRGGGTIDADGATVAGTIPRGWVVSSTGPLDLAPGVVNEGMLEVPSSSNALSDTGAFTNAGDVAIGGNGNAIRVARFVNTGTMTVSDPNLGLGNESGHGDPLVFDDYGTLSVLKGGGVELGQSNGAFCIGENDPVTLALEPHAVIDVHGSITAFCTSLVIAGGSVIGPGQVRLTGARGAGSVGVNFAVAPGQHGGGTIDADGASLAGTIPRGWTVSSTGPLDVAPGTVNVGTLAVPSSGNVLSDTGSFTNAGNLEVGGNGNAIRFGHLLNLGTVVVSDPNLDFGIESTANAPSVFDNHGTLTVLKGGAMELGQSNGYWCIGQHDPVTFVLEPNARVDLQGGLTVYCNHLDINGGELVGPGRVLLNGAQGAGSVALAFAPGVPPPPPGANDTITSDSSRLTTAVPKGWHVTGTFTKG